MKMTKWIPAAVLVAVFFQIPSASAQQQPAQPAASSPQETNIRAYIELLRSDIKTKKTAVLVQILQLNDDQSAKFWPIYREYDLELQKLNDQKLAGIQDYAKNYDSMTDEKANQLAILALALETKRTDLKRTYFEKVRDQLGGIMAAQFLQVENQMLMVIDLQIASQLPIVQK